jgi:hypothetical protein
MHWRTEDAYREPLARQVRCGRKTIWTCPNYRDLRVHLSPLSLDPELSAGEAGNLCSADKRWIGRFFAGGACIVITEVSTRINPRSSQGRARERPNVVSFGASNTAETRTFVPTVMVAVGIFGCAIREQMARAAIRGRRAIMLPAIPTENRDLDHRRSSPVVPG